MLRDIGSAHDPVMLSIGVVRYDTAPTGRLSTLEMRRIGARNAAIRVTRLLAVIPQFFG